MNQSKEHQKNNQHKNGQIRLQFQYQSQFIPQNNYGQFSSLIQGINHINLHRDQNSVESKTNFSPPNQRYYQQAQRKVTSISQPQGFSQRNTSQINTLRQNKKIQLDFSPISKFANEQQIQNEGINSQQKGFHYKTNFQKSTPNITARQDAHFGQNSAHYYSSNHNQWSTAGKFGRPKTERNDKQYKERQNSQFSSYIKKYGGSQNQTKPYTLRQSANVTGLSSLNSSYKKITNFTLNDTNYQQINRPYSNLYRPDSCASIQNNRPISYQEQNQNLSKFEKQYQHLFENRRQNNNLTALESEIIADGDGRYMKNYNVSRPLTGQYNKKNFISEVDRQQTNMSYNSQYIISPNLNQSINVKQTKINRPILTQLQQINNLNISQIHRPTYENHYVEKREFRKLGGDQQIKVVFKNNWCLLGLLLLLIIGVIAIGVWIGRNSIMEKQKYGQVKSQFFQPGIKPTYVDPTQIKHVNQTQPIPLIPINETKVPIPIQPISINITFVTPQVQVRNDTKLANSTNNIYPKVVEPVLPKQIPIVFPPVSWVNLEGKQNKTVINITLPTETNNSIINPVIVSNLTNQSKVDSKNQTNFIIQPIPVIISMNQTAITKNFTETNGNITTPTPIKILNNDTSAKLQINKTITDFEYVQAQKVKQSQLIQGYQPKGQMYFPISSEINIFTQPIKQSSQIYASITSDNVSIDANKSQSIIVPNIQDYSINYQTPIKQPQFNQSYKPITIENITQNINFIEPISVKIPTDNIIEPISAKVLTDNIIEPISVKTSTDNKIEPISAKVLTDNIIEPTIITPTINQTIVIPSIPLINISQPATQPQLLPQTINKTTLSVQIPSYIKDYIEPQKMTDFQISIPSIKQQMDLSSINPQVISQKGKQINSQTYIQPQIVSEQAYITSPEQTINGQIPSIAIIQPTQITQNSLSINPISTPIDLGLRNESISTINITNIIEPQIIPTSQANQSVIIAKNQTQTSVQIKKQQFPQFIEPTSISDLQISIPASMQTISQLPQNEAFVTPTKITSINAEIIVPSREQITPQIQKTTPESKFIQPYILEPVESSGNLIEANKDQVLTLQPEIVDTYFTFPQKILNIPQISASLANETVLPLLNNIIESATIQTTPIAYIQQIPASKISQAPIQITPISVSMQPIEIMPIEINRTQPASIQPIPIIPISIQPVKIQLQPVQIDAISAEPVIIPSQVSQVNSTQFQPTQIQPNQYILIPAQQNYIIPTTIPQQNTNQISPTVQMSIQPQVISSIQPTKVEQQILPTTQPQQISPINIDKSDFQIEPIVLPSQQIQIPAAPIQTNQSASDQILPQIITPNLIEPTVTNITDQFVQPTIQPTATDQEQWAGYPVKRLTSPQSSQVIYQIPHGFDKSLLPQIQKKFLSIYNQSLSMKSPFEIIPINWRVSGEDQPIPINWKSSNTSVHQILPSNWKIGSDNSQLLNENQYQIYFTPNGTLPPNTVNFLPENFPVKKPVLNYEIKQTILQVMPDGQMKILQKGDDWPQIQKNLENYKNYGIGSMLPLNIKAQNSVKSHNLRLINA